MIKIIIDDISNEAFYARIELDARTIEVEGDVWTDEIENLYGDQVASVSTMAYFDRITDMRVFDTEGLEDTVISLDLAKFINQKLNDSIDEEIDSRSCRVDYSPQYYDLV